MSARRAGVTAVAAVVATALLVLVLAAWAASIGPSAVLTGDGRPPVSDTPTVEQSSSAGTSEPTTTGDQQHHGTPAWVRTLAILVDIGIVVLLVYMLVRYAGRPLVSSLRERQRL